MAFIETRVPQPFTNRDGLITLPDLSKGLLIDLDADTVAGTTVSAWQSTGSNPITLNTLPSSTMNHPTIPGTRVNGHKVVQFSGNHGLRASDTSTILPVGAAGSAVIAAQWEPGGNNGSLISTGAPSPEYRGVRFFNGYFTSGVSTSAGSGNVSLPTTSPGWSFHAYVVRWDEDGTKLDSTRGVSAHSPLVAGALNGLTVGSSRVGGDPFAGKIGKIQIYDRALTDTEVNAALFSMSQRYAISV